MLNLTPHTIAIILTTGETLTVEPSGTVARVATHETDLGMMGHVPVIRRVLGEAEGLPEDTSEPVLVSAMVLAAVPGRPNTFAPDTGPTAVRDEAGRIQAVTRLVAA